MYYQQCAFNICQRSCQKCFQWIPMCYLASLIEEEALEHHNWNGIAEIMQRKTIMPYTWKGSYGLILKFYSSKPHLMDFIIM